MKKVLIEISEEQHKWLKGMGSSVNQVIRGLIDSAMASNSPVESPIVEDVPKGKVDRMPEFPVMDLNRYAFKSEVQILRDEVNELRGLVDRLQQPPLASVVEKVNKPTILHDLNENKRSSVELNRQLDEVSRISVDSIKIKGAGHTPAEIRYESDRLKRAAAFKKTNGVLSDMFDNVIGFYDSEGRMLDKSVDE